MLTITELRDAEYVISSVALGLDEYYAGIGEAPGIWTGRFAPHLGLEGVVDAEDLRAVVEGHDPRSGADLLAGRRRRRVNVFDATFSAPKSVSLLWGLGRPGTADVVSRAHTEAVSVALSFLEDHAAVARQQTKGVRRRVATAGFAVAGFFHRTSREGDPQLHTHCLIANLVRRPDGSHVAFDANPLFDWAKAAGTVYQAELQRLLSQELRVAWGPDRNGTREMAGADRNVLRAFSKRTLAIEAELEACGAVYESPASRMRADDAASLATRPAKDHSLTPSLLVERWRDEARQLGIDSDVALEAALVGRPGPRAIDPDEVTAALLDPETGLCAATARFTEAHVYAHVAALSGGRWTTAEITTMAGEFVASEHVVRLAPGKRRRPPEWSTVAHRALEDAVLEHLGALAARPSPAIDRELVEAAIAAEGRLGADQVEAVRALCGPGTDLRSMIAPAGFGKTTAVHAAATACAGAGRAVLGVATTNQAVAGLRSVGLEASTIARLRIDLTERPLAPGTVVVLDEVSQVSTRDAATVLEAVAATHGASLWCLGDPRQAPAVGAGGLGAEVTKLGAQGAIVAPALRTNRRQRERADREALAELRAGRAAASQAIRSEHGWEHEEATPLATRQAMAEAVVADVVAHGAVAVAVLAVSHADCEDLADRIRARLVAGGHLGGPSLPGPAWGAGPDRSYAQGDRVLLHTKSGHAGLHNGSTGTVVAVDDHGLAVAFDGARQVLLPSEFVAGRRGDGNPNLSHAWARTADGAQGGTWEAVHLLGSPSLNALVGYTGQSRGMAPTHTWNTRALAVADHVGLAADNRSATEAVLAGLQREPVTTFAAADDPWVLDTRLRAERDGHLAVLDAAPPDRTRELRRAEEDARQAARRADLAAGELARAEARLRTCGPLAGLRRSGRLERADAEAALPSARDGAARARARSREATGRVAAVGLEAAGRGAYLERHAWRHQRIAALDAELDRHWAAATLGAVRQDDPLAFGVERLRAARAYYAARLAARDGQAETLGVAVERGGDEQRRVAADAVAELDAALDHTRAARVRALASAGDAPCHLVAVLGEAPAGGSGRAAWCGLALQVEAYRDRHPDSFSLDDYSDVVTAIGPRPTPRWRPDAEWDGLARRLADAPAVVAVAAELGDQPGVEPDSPLAWLALVDDARGALDAVRSSPLCPPALQPERDLRADRGMSLGL